MAIRIISDFDQTLIKLDLDWAKFRSDFSIGRINDIWKLDDVSRSNAIDSLTNLEKRSVLNSNLHPLAPAILSQNVIGVLTNNSEEAVNLTFETKCKDFTFSTEKIHVLGRETLKGPKEDFEIFKCAILEICHKADQTDISEVIYMGDSDYELKYASRVGLRVFKVTQNQSDFTWHF